ncbi:hypothetical protein EDD11_003592 [Mortierella claussenii]|nr:hypothetical protein EDD11_003592 [Mortierella claussenii]
MTKTAAIETKTGLGIDLISATVNFERHELNVAPVVSNTKQAEDIPEPHEAEIAEEVEHVEHGVHDQGRQHGQRPFNIPNGDDRASVAKPLVLEEEEEEEEGTIEEASSLLTLSLSRDVHNPDQGPDRTKIWKTTLGNVSKT